MSPLARSAQSCWAHIRRRQTGFRSKPLDGQTTQGRASLTCPAGSSTFEQAFFTAYEGPISSAKRFAISAASRMTAGHLTGESRCPLVGHLHDDIFVYAATRAESTRGTATDSKRSGNKRMAVCPSRIVMSLQRAQRSSSSLTAALIGVAGINPTALAQQAKSASIPTDDLFWPDTNDFRPGAGSVEPVGKLRQASAVARFAMPDRRRLHGLRGPHRRPCIGIRNGQFAARSDRGRLARLRSFGAGHRTSTGGIISVVIITAQSAKDKEKPKLDTNSVPRKGKKVKAGDKITVTMVARDHANLGRAGSRPSSLSPRAKAAGSLPPRISRRRRRAAPRCRWSGAWKRPM